MSWNSSSRYRREFFKKYQVQIASDRKSYVFNSSIFFQISLNSFHWEIKHCHITSPIPIILHHQTLCITKNVFKNIPPFSTSKIHNSSVDFEMIALIWLMGILVFVIDRLMFLFSIVIYFSLVSSFMFRKFNC